MIITAFNLSLDLGGGARPSKRIPTENVRVVFSNGALTVDREPRRPAVVHQDRCGTCFYIVGVNAVDGEVEYDRMAWPEADTYDLHPCASRGAEGRSSDESVCTSPLAMCGIPELVVFGGGYYAGAVASFAVGVDGDLDGVLEGDPAERGDDGFEACFAGLGVGGDDLVADLDVLDALGLTVCQYHLRAGHEAVAATPAASC